MPRGPGKKENYNLDYSRFNAFDKADIDEQRVAGGAPEADAAAGQSKLDAEEFRSMMRGLPPELQEAHRLLQIARATGDKEAEKRANELAMKSVERGSPEVKERFLQEMRSQMPEISGRLEGDDPVKAISALVEEAQKPTAKKSDMEEVSGAITSIQADMERGQKEARRQLDALQKQQDLMERLQSPEDFCKFMHEGGMTPEDVQRCLAGDMEHMEKCMSNMLKTTEKEEEKVAGAESALQAADALHSALCGGKAEADAAAAGAAPPAAAPKQPKPAAPPEPEVQIPEHRLQYQKDADGRFTAVELRCALPGVLDMGAVDLDVSDKHLRLNTRAPGPIFAVNAGPFPVRIDPSAAKAKFSKKRAELHITVPALP